VKKAIVWIYVLAMLHQFPRLFDKVNRCVQCTIAIKYLSVTWPGVLLKWDAQWEVS